MQISFFSVLGAVALAILAVFNFEKIVMKMLVADLDGLKVREEDLHKFITEASQTNYWKKNAYTWKKKSFFILYHYLPKIGWPYEFKYYQIKARIVGEFLLSTDFFFNKMDRSKPVSYIGIYDPYHRPCQNPFSNLHYQSA